MNTYCPACINPDGYGTIGHSGEPKYCEKHLVAMPTEQFHHYVTKNYYTYEPTYEPKPKKRIWRAR